MREFHSLTALALELGEIALAQHEMEQKGLERCAKLVEKRAKEKIGEYQPEAGPFAAWTVLADATQADREKHGFSPADPLLRTGTLRESIEYVVQDGEAHVGSNSDVAVYQELGTRHIPPRSFLGGAMAEKLNDVRRIVGESAVAALVGDHVFNRKMEIE